MQLLMLARRQFCEKKKRKHSSFDNATKDEEHETQVHKDKALKRKRRRKNKSKIDALA